MATFGGHKQAAGLTLESSRVSELRARVSAYADRHLQPDDVRPRLSIDGRLTFSAIDDRVVSDLSALGPFGIGNPRPVFSADSVEIVDGPRILKERHLKLSFRQDGKVIRAIAWRAADRERFVSANRGAIDVAFSLEQDTWRGEHYLQLSVADFRAPEG
jgi:single-stranded-DNA-specific exonuclease